MIEQLQQEEKVEAERRALERKHAELLKKEVKHEQKLVHQLSLEAEQEGEIEGEPGAEDVSGLLQEQMRLEAKLEAKLEAEEAKLEISESEGEGENEAENEAEAVSAELARPSASKEVIYDAFRTRCVTQNRDEQAPNLLEHYAGPLDIFVARHGKVYGTEEGKDLDFLRQGRRPEKCGIHPQRTE